jgi:hypothetical protein
MVEDENESGRKERRKESGGGRFAVPGIMRD